MADSENPDYEDWNPDADSQMPTPVPEPPKHGASRKARSHRTSKEKEPTEKRIREWVLVLITLVLAIAGIRALSYYRGQLEVMQGQLSEIVKQYPEIQKQASAAQGQLTQARNDSADARTSTAKQLDTMQRELTQQRAAMQLDQRAWVTLDHYELQPVEGSGKPKQEWGQAFAALRNTGKTPALNVCVVRGAFIKEGGSPNDADGRWMDLITQMVEKGTLGPGGMLVAPRTRKLDKWGHDWAYESLKGLALFDDRLAPPDVLGRQDSIITPQKGSVGVVVPQTDPLKVPVGLSFSNEGGPIVVIYGSVFYDDVFGGRHKTDFCGIAHAGVPTSAFNTYSVHGDWIDFTTCAVHNKME